MAHISKQLRKKRSPNTANVVSMPDTTQPVKSEPTIVPVAETVAEIVETQQPTEPVTVESQQEHPITIPSPKTPETELSESPTYETEETTTGIEDYPEYDEDDTNDGDIEKWEEQATINPFLELGLPPHITSWKLFPSPYDEDHNIMVHYVDSKPVSHMLLSPVTAQDYVESLNEEMLLDPENLADSWFIKTPDNPKLPPQLHLTTNGVITNSVPLTEDLMKELMPKMLKVYNPSKPKAHRENFLNWAAEHKIKATILGIIILGPFLYGTYTYFL